MSPSPWYRELNRYHWLVLVVASLGWLCDCMDQQLFNLARRPAMLELLHVRPGDASMAGPVAEYAGYATMIFMIGWASGGVLFGILGDRIGRVKTMVLSILFYSAFTGLSVLSTGVWDFSAYRFLTGRIRCALAARNRCRTARGRSLLAGCRPARLWATS